MIDRLLAKRWPAEPRVEFLMAAPKIKPGMGLSLTTVVERGVPLASELNAKPTMNLILAVKANPMSFVTEVTVVELKGGRLAYWRAKWAAKRQAIYAWEWLRGRRPWTWARRDGSATRAPYFASRPSPGPREWQ